MPCNIISANIGKISATASGSSQMFYKKNCAPSKRRAVVLVYSDLFLDRSDSELVAHLLLRNAILRQCAYVVTA